MMYSLYMNANEEGQRSVVALSTPAGAKLYAVWKQKKDRWHLVEATNEMNPLVLDILTPRQFLDAIEKGSYFFE
jgi:hypothetical protein